MDPKNEPQFNPKIPISEVLKQEQTGFTPSAPAIPKPPIIPSTPIPGQVLPTNQAAAPVAPSQIKIIKTYRSDAEEAVKAQQASVAKIAMAQQEQRRAQGEEIGAVAPKKGHGLLFMAIVLILLGAAAVPTVKYILNKKTEIVPVAVEKTILPFDRQETLTLETATRDNFIGAIDALAAKPPVASNIEYRKILEKTLDDNQKPITKLVAPNIFAMIAGPSMPSALARSFDSNYMYGTAGQQNPQPFMIFRTSSYELTFANMLRWEEKMITDLVPILNLSTELIGKTFTDRVLLNKDVRAVTAADGTILFLYGFLDNQTLVITTSPQTFQDINTRYVASRFVQ